MNSAVSIGILGDFDPSSEAHHATNEALRHAAGQLAVDLDYTWLATPQVEWGATRFLESFDGIWAAPGSPLSVSGALDGIRFARERMWPFVGT